MIDGSPNHPLSKCFSSKPADCVHTKVADLIHDNTITWNVPLLYILFFFFFPEEVELIRSIPLSLRRVKDNLICGTLIRKANSR